MTGPTRQALEGERWFLQHGPINCIVFAEGEATAVAAAHEATWQRFTTVLTELVSELPLLKTDLHAHGAPAVKGRIALAMVAACLPHAASAFITPMAAVAGAVADELLRHLGAPGITRAYVNNGGDIALHLSEGMQWDIGLIAGLQVTPSGRFSVRFEDAVRGVATSGWRGRSFSFGIADAVTVLAASAAQADAAATLAANAVNVRDARIQRRPACELKDDSDLGQRLVTTAVPVLAQAQVAAALEAGVQCAAAMRQQGLLSAAVLSLQGTVRVLEPSGLQLGSATA